MLPVVTRGPYLSAFEMQHYKALPVVTRGSL